MAVDDHAETGTLTRHGARLVLRLAAGGHCEVDAWPDAARHVGQEVHVVGTLAPDNVLVARSIALVGAMTASAPFRLI